MAEEKIETKLAETKQEKEEQVKPESKKEIENKKPKEEKKELRERIKHAIVNGVDLSISTKEAADVCDMIRGKDVDNAIKMIEEVMEFKRVVKMNKREVPHQHGKGIMAGRYPINSAKEFLRLLKQLKANALHHEIEIEKCSIECKADRASRPYRRAGMRFKRSHVLLWLKQKQELKNKENNKEDKSNKKIKQMEKK